MVCEGSRRTDPAYLLWPLPSVSVIHGWIVHKEVTMATVRAARCDTKAGVTNTIHLRRKTGNRQSEIGYYAGCGKVRQKLDGE